MEPNDKKCCGNCIHYDGSYCTVGWNNLDPIYKTERDKREEDAYCGLWEVYDDAE